jgi:hypothetical protein
MREIKGGECGVPSWKEFCGGVLERERKLVQLEEALAYG